MNNQEILEKAIQKAIDGGWKPWVVPLDPNLPTPQWAVRIMEIANWAEIIFNHDFAKALWGNPERHRGGDLVHTIGETWDDMLMEWQWQLQQMVIAEDPIKYLGDNL